MPGRIRATKAVDGAQSRSSGERVRPNRNESKRNLRLLRASGLGLALVSVGLLVAACGSGSGSPGVASLGATNPKSASSAASAGHSGGGSVDLRYDKCMQTHGVANWPDPGAGVAALRKVDFGSPQFKAALKTCRAEFPSIGATPTTPLSPKILAEALKFTQCMRSHGVPNWPEPTSTYYVAPPSRSFANSPADLRAAKACHGLIPERS
jgi:hypothetical protein